MRRRSHLERVFWQISSLNQSLRAITHNNCLKITLFAFYKFTGDDLNSLPVEKKIAQQKKNLNHFFDINTRICGFNFFKIDQQKPLIKKRKNTNLNIGFEAVMYKNYDNKTLNNFFSILIFWKKILTMLRNGYKLHSGYRKSVNLRSREIRITIINPLYIDAYLEQRPKDQFSDDDNCIITFIIKHSNLSVIRDLSKFI